jgi:hypothetical protein
METNSKVRVIAVREAILSRRRAALGSTPPASLARASMAFTGFLQGDVNGHPGKLEVELPAETRGCKRTATACSELSGNKKPAFGRVSGGFANLGGLCRTAANSVMQEGLEPIRNCGKLGDSWRERREMPPDAPPPSDAGISVPRSMGNPIDPGRCGSRSVGSFRCLT